MKSALALSLSFYLGCAASLPAPSIPPPVIEIEPVSRVEKEIIHFEGRPFRQEMQFVTGSFRQMMRQRNQHSLEGVLGFENSTESLEYNYDTSIFCDFDTQKKFDGKITLEYSQIQGVQGKYQITVVTLTDIPPFG